MTAPQRIQRRRTKGWRMPEGAVYVGRPTVWGNPFGVGSPVTIEADQGADAGFQVELVGSPHGATAAQAVAGYRDLMQLRLCLPPHDTLGYDEDSHGSWWTRLGLIRDRTLACWCPLDQPCHADVLLELANGDVA